jgi:hypothetical protein
MYYNEYWIDRSLIVFDHISVSIIHKASYNLDFVSAVSFYIMALKESGQSPEGMFLPVFASSGAVFSCYLTYLTALRWKICLLSSSWLCPNNFFSSF